MAKPMAPSFSAWPHCPMTVTLRFSAHVPARPNHKTRKRPPRDGTQGGSQGKPPIHTPRAHPLWLPDGVAEPALNAQHPALNAQQSYSPRIIAISTPPDEGAMAGEPPACSEHGHRSLFRLYRSGYHPRRLSRHSHRGGDASTADGVGLDGSKTRVEEGNGARCRGVVKPRLGKGVSGSKYSPMYPC